MSYYILPKINNNIIVEPESSDNILSPYISHSLFNYYNEAKQQIISNCSIYNVTDYNVTNNDYNVTDNDNDLSYNKYDELIKIVNPYEYIFSTVPGSKFSVSKIKPKTNIFYDFLEVSMTLNVFDLYKSESIKTLHLTKNNNDSIECFEMLRENFDDQIFYYDQINDETINLIGDNKFDFLFFEARNVNLNEYVISLIEVLMIILKNQSLHGSCIIKIYEVFHKPVIDILYILSSLYEKTYILKPNASNITTFDKYIICKNFQTNNDKVTNFKFNYYKLFVFLKRLNDKNIKSIINYEIPYYFTMKLDDINIIFGQQQLESLDLVINILKNKNKEDKIESIKKTNIQKAVAWCEKYKIPCNKFSEKINIFLPINREATAVDAV
jgi:23S rRNA U2552 (ribose-2'-O)-methylase RlmE/FtsJ